MLNIRCLKDLRIWLPQWVSPASHLTLPKTHFRDSLCSAVNAHLRRWWHKQTVIWQSIVIAPKRCRRRSFFLPLHLFHFKTISFRTKLLRWRRSKLWRWWPLLDPIKVSRKPVPEYYRHWNNTGPSSHQLYSRHHRLKRRLDHIS